MKGAAQTVSVPVINSADDPLAAARAARLRYVGDWQPGISRRETSKGFVYIDDKGKRIQDREELRRIKSLVIPPAWKDVWICSRPDGHLQACGRDARGRKQYRYHARWREVRDENKYERMIAFGQALPAIRARVEHDLALPGLPRAKVLATVVKLLESTHIRVGNEEYARSNRSFGLATLRNRHVKVRGENIRFEFRGKSGVEHAIDLQDKRLAPIIKRCQDLPGYELFQYVDETGAHVAVEASDVNEYLREIAGAEFSTKDFRTWAGTSMAARVLRSCEVCDSKAQIKKNIVTAIENVAQALGNTKAVCRKCYIHPFVIDSYSAGTLSRKVPRRRVVGESGAQRLSPEEAALLALLQAGVRAPAGKEKLTRKRKVSSTVARLSRVFAAPIAPKSKPSSSRRRSAGVALGKSLSRIAARSNPRKASDSSAS
jgi:DNA topoisomerase-1